MTQITLDGSLGSPGPQALAGPDYRIDASLGERRGGNLFHSFGRFNLSRGESAIFTGPENITNILGRVTGGEPSQIDGIIRSEIPGANLFLLNPAGVLFGPHATLEVNGSFYASTADALRLGNAGRFMANPAVASVLTVAPPEAFGFLGPPTAIIVEGSALQASAGRSLGLVGGDLTLTGQGNFSFDRPTLTALGGRIHLASVAAAGEVPLFLPENPLTLTGITAERLGQVTIRHGALLEASSEDGGGTVLIQARRLQVIDKAGIAADTLGNGNGAAVGVNLHIQDDLLVNDAFIESGVFSGARGHAGAIQITAGSVEVRGSKGFVGSPSQNESTGARGNVTIVTGQLLVAAGSIDTNTRDAGPGGVITITADHVEVREGGRISSDGLAGSSALREDVVIQAGTLLVTGAGSRIGTNTEGSGPAGDVRITAEHIAVRDEGRINSEGLPGSTGSRGSVQLAVADLLLAEGARIDTTTEGLGGGGAIEIQATRSVVITSEPGRQSGEIQSVVSSRTAGSGDAGRITITAAEILLEDGAIRASSRGEESGRGGDIIVEAARLTLERGAQISSGTFGQAAGGTVTVRVSAALTISGQNVLGEQSALSSATQPGSLGDGGQVVVEAAPATVTLQDSGTISVRAFGEGDAGGIRLEARHLFIHSGGQIVSATTSPGAGGNLVIQAQGVTLDTGGSITASSTGAGNAGTINIRATEQFRGQGGDVTTAADIAGGGNITLSAPLINLLDSRITAEARGASRTGSDGGNVRIEAERVVLNRSLVVADAFGGDGGNIAIRASRVFLADAVTCDRGQCLSASSALGIDGTVEISSPVTNVSGTLAPLSQTFSSAATLSRDRCAGRHSGSATSQFVLSGRDGVPVEPGYVLPSPFYAKEKLSASIPKVSGQIPQQELPFSQADNGSQMTLAMECMRWQTQDKVAPSPLR